MKLIKGGFLLVFSLIVSCTSFSQTEIHSGFLQNVAQTGADALKIHCDQLSTDDIANQIITEMQKYTAILDVRCDKITHKVIVKYVQPCNTNFVLGILNHIYLDAYYLENGLEIRYVKSPSDQFLR